MWSKITKKILTAFLLGGSAFLLGIVFIIFDKPDPGLGPAAIGVGAVYLIMTCFFSALIFLTALAPSQKDLEGKPFYIKITAFIIVTLMGFGIFGGFVYAMTDTDQIYRRARQLYSPPEKISITQIIRNMMNQDRDMMSKYRKKIKSDKESQNNNIELDRSGVPAN